MNSKIYLLTIIALLCISCKNKKANTVQTNAFPIDTAIQQIAVKALYNQLQELNADAGTVVIMDTETGNIKAATHKSYINGNWKETENFSVNDSIEAVSLFKIPCMLVALEDNVISPNDEIDTGNGVLEYKGITVKDRNFQRGGYGKITAEQVILTSSNVGMANILLKGYENNPNAIIEGLNKLGFIGIPKDKSMEDYLFFKHRMKIPIINVLEFYNTIANGTTKCSPSSLKAIRKMLVNAVSNGMERPAKSEKVLIAGTTEIQKDAVLFCGYFPADNPKYSCIVKIDISSDYPSNIMAGSVFKEIAERIIKQ